MLSPDASVYICDSSEKKELQGFAMFLFVVPSLDRYTASVADRNWELDE